MPTSASRAETLEQAELFDRLPILGITGADGKQV